MKKRLPAILAGFGFALSLAALGAPDESQVPAMWHGMEGIGWGWFGLGVLHMVLFWGLVVLGLVLLLRALGGGSRAEPRAMDILEARYAKGELTREQFEQLKREIGKPGN